MRMLSLVTFDSMGFADDLATVNKNMDQILNCIKTIEQWTEENGMSLNKNKSGIIILDGVIKEDNIRGIPIVKEYKYLGVWINKKMNPTTHINRTIDNVKEYLNRNTWLKKRAFSLKSLGILNDIFSNSRLLYGMCSFLDKPKKVKKIDKFSVKMMTSLADCNRLGIGNEIFGITGKSLPSHRLLLRYHKIRTSFKNNFHYEPIYDNESIKKYIESINDIVDSELDTNKILDIDYIDFLTKVSEFSSRTILNNIYENSSTSLYYVIKKYWWKWSTLGDKVHMQI